MNRLADYSLYLYVALAAVFAAMLAVSILNYALTQAPPASVPQTTKSNVTTRSQVAIGVTERNLFGIEKSLPMLATGQNTMSSSGFNGKLTGILLGPTLADSRAIIVESSGFVQVVKSTAQPAADAPMEGYLLKEIDRESAVIEYSGQDYALRLEAGALSSTPAASSFASSKTAAAPAVSGVTATDQDHYLLERGELVEQLSDINRVISSMLVSPAYDNGEFLGYRVTRMRDDAPLQALGIQRGDIINRINGEELTNPQVLFDMLGKVGDISAVSLDIVRGDEKKTIFVEIQ